MEASGDRTASEQSVQGAAMGRWARASQTGRKAVDVSKNTYAFHQHLKGVDEAK